MSTAEPTTYGVIFEEQSTSDLEKEQPMLPVAGVALPIPVDKPFSYAVPPEMQGIAEPGCRVMVSFGSRTMTGMIVDIQPAQPLESNVKPVLDLLDETPSFSPEMLEFTRWIASYYLCSWGEVIRAALPSGTDQEQEYIIRPALDVAPTKPGSKTLERVLEILNARGSVTVKELRQQVKQITLAVLRTHEKAGWITIESHLKKPKVRVKKAKYIRLVDAVLDPAKQQEARSTIRGSRQLLILDTLVSLWNEGQEFSPQSEVLARTGATSSTITSLVKRGIVAVEEREVIRTPLGEMAEDTSPPPRYALHEAQEKALERIAVAVDQNKFETFLLHGVTGSGKTEVYITALKAVLAQGKTGIVLVPEIALTPQTVARFRAHFGDQIAVLHSRMSPGERYDAWRNLRNGRFSIVIGPRSAILAPLSDVGLIVVDEEHESSYKQFDPAPRYHARDVAVMRAQMNNAVCILGSATPSLESYVNAHAGKKYTYLSMPNRVPVPGHEAAPLPAIRMIDLTIEKRKRRLQGALTQALRLAISDRLERKEQIILLQNRRGYSSIVECRDCGWSPTCVDCAVTLTYHKVQHHLRCHYCGQTQRLTRKCPDCGGTDIARLGAGTQRIEEELEAQFPSARVLRMDLDTTTGKNAHFKILDQFARGEADILIGTQMVAKGLDFGRVTLVGVVNADVGMLLPDFRAEERTFQLLTQVAGRAGRSQLRGEVILQTRNTKHPVLRYAAQHDYASFAQAALGFRRELGYPPFGRVVRVEFKGPDEKITEQLALKWHKGLRMQEGIQVMGPQPAFISRVQKNYRFHIILKATRRTSIESLAGMIKSATSKAGTLPRNFRIAVDVDAVALF